MKLNYQNKIGFGMIVLASLLSSMAAKKVQAQTLPQIIDDPLFYKFRLGMDSNKAERIGRSGSRPGGFREIGSIRVMYVFNPSGTTTGVLLASRRTGKITSIMSFANESTTKEQLISLLPNYTKSIQVDPGTLLDTTWIRNPDLPSTILCTSGQYAFTFQYIDEKNSPYTQIGAVALPWLEEQLTEFRKIRRNRGDDSKADIANVCK